MSKQPLTREELDNRLTLNRHEKYWHDVSSAFSSEDTSVKLFVQDQTVLSYLEDELDVSHRRTVSPGECKKQYSNIRSNYECSVELANFRRSGQGNPNFFQFCNRNPIYLLLHYMMEDAKNNGECDLAVVALSLMDVTKHVNTMPTAGATEGGTTTTELDEDVASDHHEKKKGRKYSRSSFMKRLSNTLDNVLQQYNRCVVMLSSSPTCHGLCVCNAVRRRCRRCRRSAKWTSSTSWKERCVSRR